MTTLIRLPEACRRLGIRKTEFYRRIAQGEPPAPIKLGARASAWIEEEIEAAAQRLIRASREAARIKKSRESEAT